MGVIKKYQSANFFSHSKLTRVIIFPQLYKTDVAWFQGEIWADKKRAVWKETVRIQGMSQSFQGKKGESKEVE